MFTSVQDKKGAVFFLPFQGCCLCKPLLSHTVSPHHQEFYAVASVSAACLAIAILLQDKMGINHICWLCGSQTNLIV
jgi:hypothetical protein